MNCLMFLFMALIVPILKITSEIQRACDLEREIFEPYSQTCFLKAGAKCEKDASIGIGGYKCLPNSLCLTTSTDSDEYICTCLDGLVPNANGCCHLVFNASCTSLVENGIDLCDPIQRLHCSSVSGRCSCAEDSFYLKEEVPAYGLQPGCVLKPGTECNLSPTQCGPYSLCKWDSTEEKFLCTCELYFTPSSDDMGQCLVPHGRPCNENLMETCSRPFVCDEVAKNCICPIGSEYDPATETCFILANHTCDSQVQDGMLECAPNSICSSNLGRCVCEQPLKANDLGQCFLAHGDDCESGWWPCDENLGLICQHSVCECPYGSIFKNGQCILLAGSTCSTAGNMGSHNCIMNSECQESGTGDKYSCICVNGTIANAAGYCYKTYGNTCNNGNVQDECNPLEFLECTQSTGICSCPNDMKYYITNPDSLTKGSCRLLPGSKCGTSSTTTTEQALCIPNANCTNKTCQCSHGYELDNCDRSFGFNCSNNAGETKCTLNTECLTGICECPAYMPNYYPMFPNSPGCLPGLNQPCLETAATATTLLTCSPTMQCNPLMNICECQHPVQIHEENACVSLVDGQCSIDLELQLYCVENAECTFIGQDDVYGICKCKDNFTENVHTKKCTTASSGATIRVLKVTSAATYKFITVLCLFIFIITNLFH